MIEEQRTVLAHLHAERGRIRYDPIGYGPCATLDLIEPRVRSFRLFGKRAANVIRTLLGREWIALDESTCGIFYYTLTPRGRAAIEERPER